MSWAQGTVFISDSHAVSFRLALEDSRQMLPLLPKPGRDWPNEPINQFWCLAWEGLKQPARPIIRSAAEAAAEHSLAQRERSPSLSLDKGCPLRWREVED